MKIFSVILLLTLASIGLAEEQGGGVGGPPCEQRRKECEAKCSGSRISSALATVRNAIANNNSYNILGDSSSPMKSGSEKVILVDASHATRISTAQKKIIMDIVVGRI
ncbi:hypothetical protein HYFRA_00000965 [Hymenoscyphus fraxineus]|uniref:Uncharacterized protein n=1 Tax=Hymenoscyphus fraxineus TaxID=746836 RepID=A0A9N9KQH1_9HELO|nr:hypothetical protein HYFRA_00000965 [Hymenoscyphus fraxineus]